MGVGEEVGVAQSNSKPVDRDLLRQRNSYILAHGLEPIGEGSARRFLEYVDARVDEPRIRAAAEHARLAEL